MDYDHEIIVAGAGPPLISQPGSSEKRGCSGRGAGKWFL